MGATWIICVTIDKCKSKYSKKSSVYQVRIEWNSIYQVRLEWNSGALAWKPFNFLSADVPEMVADYIFHNVT